MARKNSIDAVARKPVSRRKAASARPERPSRAFEFSIAGIQSIRIQLLGQGVVVPNPPRPRTLTFMVEIVHGD